MEKTESAMMERLEQLLSELRVKAECGETLNQLVSGLEQFMSTITPNQPKDLDLDLDLETSSVAEAVPNRERDNNDIRDEDEDEDEYEYASDYFCLTEVLADVFNRQRDNGIKAAKGDADATVYFCPFLFSDGCWFAIPPRKVKVKGKRNVLCRVIVEPKHIQPSLVQPFTLGPYLVLIIDATKKNLYELERDVYYINVTKPGAVWVKAPTFIGSEISFFFVANYKIYGLGWSEGDKISLKFLDFHRLEEGLEEAWQSKSPNGYISPRLFDTNRVLAFMLQCKEDSNTSSQVDTDLRAFIFTRHHCISYDLTSNALSLSKEVLYKLWDYHVYDYCQGVFVGGTMYMLMKVIGDYCIMACNPRDGKCCFTRVTGLEKDGVFPLRAPYNLSFPTRLLHLGKSRACLLWSRTAGGITQVHCTKFDLCEDHGQYFAQNVSTKVYNVTGSGYVSPSFRAISISSSMG